jgi:hypothetical protein
MPNTNAPRGFLPVGTADGRPLSGALRKYQIAYNYSTPIYQNDVVKFITTGLINKASASDLNGSTIRPRGIFAGVQWVGGDGIPVFKNYWPGAQTTLGNQNAFCWVYDDPNLLMEAQFTNSSSVPVQADMGALFNLYDAGGSTQTGLSGEGLDYSTLATSALPFRALSFVERGDNDITSSGGAYSRVLCTFATHDFSVATTAANAVGI